MALSGRRTLYADARLRESPEDHAQEQGSRAVPGVEDFLTLRPAVPADLPALLAIRDCSGADALSDPALVTEIDLLRLIAAGAVMVAASGGTVAGFAAIDGDRIHLLVDGAQRSKGIGRALLGWACAAVSETGHAAAIVALAAESAAGHHYRAAGWAEIGPSPVGGTVLKKPC
jgi:GNAT superfamily N-acetyltransferase